MKLYIVPITQDEAQAYINQNHRHHKAPVGSIFQVAASDGEKIIGVAMVGNPVARELQDGFTAEVNRLCTDGSKNVCSLLYAACWRVARNLGYHRLVTYILNTEPGTSLHAAGWKFLYQTKGGTWDRKSRPRVDKHPTQPKLCFEKRLDSTTTPQAFDVLPESAQQVGSESVHESLKKGH